MSLNRETQMTLNFRSIYSDNRVDSEKYFVFHMKLSNPNCSFSSKLAELSRHKGYDGDMTHGFVTFNIRYEPDMDIQHNPDRLSLSESATEKDDERDTSAQQ